MELNPVPFSGVIRAATPDGRSGVVVLDRPHEGKEYVVISSDTKGRVELMNGKGKLVAETRVKGQATVGSQSLLAISVELDPHK
jgi:hypothetical protein